MATFLFQGVGVDGAPRWGEIEAVNRQEALQKLLGDRIQPSSLAVKGGGKSNLSAFLPVIKGASFSSVGEGTVKLKRQQVIAFTDELADFLESGLQLESALQIMRAQEEVTPQSRISALLREKVREGITFSAALRLTSPSFGELYCRVVEAGEFSGELPVLIRRQLQYLQTMEDLRQRIQMALIYPAFLLGAAALAVIVFLAFLVPQMTDLLVKTGGTIPLPTLILMRIGHFLQSSGLLLIALLLAAFALFYHRIKRGAGRQWWDEFKLRLPLVGSLLSQEFQAQFCQTLANLLQNGVSLHQALTLMGSSVGNLYHRRLIGELITHLSEGLSLTRAMKAVGFFPSSLRDQIKVGEQTGELGSCLEKVGRKYDKIIRQQMEKIMALIQPVIVVCMGVMVFLIAWSMMSGIFQAMHGLQRHR